MPENSKEQRNWAILEAHEMGKKNPEIAERYKITRERVRQIIRMMKERKKNELSEVRLDQNEPVRPQRRQGQDSQANQHH